MKIKVKTTIAKTIPRVKATLQGTKLHSFGAEIRDDLKLFKC